MKSRHDEMRERCAEFHRDNPMVWQLFCRFTQEIRDRGFHHYSVNAIFERIRWETDQADTEGRSTFKLNNNFRAFYARAYMRRYPDMEGFFRLREQISASKKAANLPPLGPVDYPQASA